MVDRNFLWCCGFRVFLGCIMFLYFFLFTVYCIKKKKKIWCNQKKTWYTRRSTLVKEGWGAYWLSRLCIPTHIVLQDYACCFVQHCWLVCKRGVSRLHSFVGKCCLVRSMQILFLDSWDESVWPEDTGRLRNYKKTKDCLGNIFVIRFQFFLGQIIHNTRSTHVCVLLFDE